MDSLHLIARETISGIDFEQITKHPNILIAARFWEEDRYQAATILYRFMRRIDDMIDDRKALVATLSCMEKKMFSDHIREWLDCLGQESSDDPFFRDVKETIRRFHIPLPFFHDFAHSMIYDIHHTGFPTLRDFLDYAEGASNGPASVFVHLCLLEKVDGEYLPAPVNISDVARPCAIFSYLVHIIRDFQKDQRDHLNYFAHDILSRYGLSPRDLSQIANGEEVSQGFREVIREYKDLADRYRRETEILLGMLENHLEPRYFLSLKIIFELYVKIFERIDPDNGQFTTEELNPAPEEIRESVLQCVDKMDWEKKAAIITT